MALLLLAAAILISIFLTVADKLNMMYMLILILIGTFTIVPVTQYVYLDHIVTFECATNMTEILYFDVGRALPFSVIPSSLPNGGTKISLSLTAMNESNGTGVTCHVLNRTATETVYIYVQGLYDLFA